jgi:hypothetical protein
MPVVSNTSPLLNLAIVDQLHLLRQQFPEVITPAAVRGELQLDTSRPGAAALRAAFAAGWLQEAPITNMHLAQSLRLDLDNGEAEAIALALEKNATHILLDERDARTAARLLGLRPVGVLGIVLLAKERGDLQAVQPVIDRLRNEAGFFIAGPLATRVLEAAGEA